MSKPLQLCLIFCVILGWVISAQAQDVASSPAMVILNIEGTIDFSRSGWAAPQPLLAGALVNTDDLIFPENASLVVLCPDGTTTRFEPDDLLPNDVLTCAVDPSNYIIGNPGMQRLNVQRGGREDANIPYLVSPRATVLRDPQLELVWNHPANATSYTIILREDSRTVWESDALDPADVVEGNLAHVTPPITLQADLPYTVEICAQFKDAAGGCTTDPGWAMGASTAFFYHPDPAVDDLETRLIAGLGEDTPESLYARAMLFSQPVAALSTEDLPIGYYQEAISLVERIQKDYPDSELAQSPELYNELGMLYRSVHLPASAARVFEQSAGLAQPATEAFATALQGRAMSEDALNFYNEALDAYAAFLTEDAFSEQFTGICQNIGEACLDLDYCQANADSCLDILLN